MGNMLPATLLTTFAASMKSIGTACTMTAVGVYLHEMGIVGKEGKRTLALISQQVTVPLYLFTKILYCNQDWSDKPCPDITKSLGDVWILLFWPLYVVGTGLIVGWVIAKLTNTPKHQIRAAVAACGFGNSTGLPITLLTVVHENFPSTSDLGRIDPSLFLSVYLLLYPALQWGIGGWLLTANLADDEKSKTTPDHRHMSVLNNKPVNDFYNHHRHGLTSADECLYVSEPDLKGLNEEKEEFERTQSARLSVHFEGMDHDESFSSPDRPSSSEKINLFLDGNTTSYGSVPESNESNAEVSKLMSSRSLTPEKDGLVRVTNYEVDHETILKTLRNIFDRCLQPPVIASIVAIIAAVTPLRGVFVDIVHRNGRAPLQWMFDGLYSIGHASVPMNMMILGCNLSPFEKRSSDRVSDGLFSMPTMVGIIIGKMVILPIIGIASAIILRKYFWNIPPNIDGSFYLVIMIVFLCPTANNVMVMVELSESNAKEGIARVIALQYAFAPLILGATMTIAVGVASAWS